MKKHQIDSLFPITLFFVLTVFALMVIVLAAGIYEDTTKTSHRNHQSRIALSYISEKIHQNNDCAIHLDHLGAVDALAVSHSFKNEHYYTYIYFYNGSLRELFIKEGVSVTPDSGKIILELQDFSIKETADRLLYFSCTDKEGQTADSYVSIPDERNFL